MNSKWMRHTKCIIDWCFIKEPNVRLHSCAILSRFDFLIDLIDEIVWVQSVHTKKSVSMHWSRENLCKNIKNLRHI